MYHQTNQQTKYFLLKKDFSNWFLKNVLIQSQNQWTFYK